MISSKQSKLVLTISLLIFFTRITIADSASSGVFDNLNLEAGAVFVLDLTNSKVIWSKNPEAQLPLASLTKLMTAYTALHLKIATKEELCFMLTTSSNELADEIFGRFPENSGDRMRHFDWNIRDMNLHQTFYLNPSGLDISDKLSGAYGSARDQAMLMGVMFRDYPEILRCTTKDTATLDGKIGSNTNKEIAHMTGIIGSKTGYTDLAGGNLAVVVDVAIGHPVAIVVMGSSEQGRFSDVEQLISATLHYLSINND